MLYNMREDKDFKFEMIDIVNNLLESLNPCSYLVCALFLL